MSQVAKTNQEVILRKVNPGKMRPPLASESSTMVGEETYRDPRAEFVLASLFLDDDEDVTETAIILYEQGFKTVRQVAAAGRLTLRAALEGKGVSEKRILTLFSVLTRIHVLPAQVD
ncbi:MAG: hypothetical protein AAF936_11800 [Pseudomonadota bacterium]